MAKKRKRSQETPWDLFVSFMILCALFFAGYSFVKTNSFVWAGAAFAGVIGILFLLNWIRLWLHNDRLRRAGMPEIDQMSGQLFEEFLRNLFQRKGYTVKMTPTSGDFGADLVMEKDGVRIVVQAKRYKGNIGIKAVQEVIGAKAHYKAQLAWVITNSSFTDAAEALAKSNGVTLFDREKLIDMIET